MKTILQTAKAGFITMLIFLAINGFSGGLTWSTYPSPTPPPLVAPITTIGNNVVCSGYTFVVPVTVTSFTNVGSISLKFAYDTTMVVYQSAIINPALSGLTPTYGVNLGNFSLSASGLTGVSLADGSTLMSITFLAKLPVSGTTFFSWSTVPSDCEYAPPPPAAPFIAVPFGNYFVNGNCNILLSPVPSLSGPTPVCLGTTGNVYTTNAGKSNYIWTVSAGGIITAGGTSTSNTVTVTWNTSGVKAVTVNYNDLNGCAAPTATNYAVTVDTLPVPTITSPIAVIPGGITVQGFKTEVGMTNYAWTVSAAGAILNGQGTDSLTVTWTNPVGNQSVTVTYHDGNGCSPSTPTSYIVLYYPYAGPINPYSIKQFVEPLPHFAAGLRVNAKAGGNLLVKAVPVQQIAVSRGTVLANGDTIGGINPNAGKGNYQAYAISTDNGATFGPAMWPAQTIEASEGHGLNVQYRNDLYGMTYADFNILQDQTLMEDGYTVSGNVFTDPYSGPIPMVTHLHGGEIPSNSDGGPTSWFMPGYSQHGPGFAHDASTLCTYPNQQEGPTLWYHPHDEGLTRINVYCGLAGFYFLRGTNEDALHLPGWSGDDYVREITPAGKYPTFNGSNTYLPEIEIAIQDRMFNVLGQLYWPVAPTNPDTHPYWTPEFFGNIFTVNGKTWPYLSVAPRKYAFRMLDGCNARFLNMWLTTDTATGVKNGPPITRISTEGGFLDAPVVLDPTQGQTLFLAPAERPIVIIDFTGYAPGTVFYLMNDAIAPYPSGDPVIHGLTDRIMQFVVNGEMVSNSPPATPADKSVVPANLRPLNPMVKLTDFNLNLNVTPVKTRQLLLNEITGAGGPLIVSINNSRFVSYPDNGKIPQQFGNPTEIPTEGTTEVWQIINTTADAHPMHPHLVQWQLVSRRPFDVAGYLAAYAAAWAPRGLPNFPSFASYPGGSGSPFPYDSVNTDGAIGGNPSVSPFYTGPAVAPPPEERGWKDSFKAFPGEVSTYICRVAPTTLPTTATVDQLVYSFDPSTGPGYVWHCHIIDHEDMDMMRPNPISASPARYPLISAQPAPFTACVGDVVTFNVVASSLATITYQWQISTDGGTVWNDLTATGPYTNVGTSTLNISPAALGLSGYLYRCRLTNVDGVTISASAALTVNNCAFTGTLKYFNAGLTPLTGMTVTVNSVPPITSAAVAGDGSFNIANVPSGTYSITVNPNGKVAGGINSTDAGLANYWGVNGGAIEQTKFLAGDVLGDWWMSAADAQRIQQHFVFGTSFPRGNWVFWPAGVMVMSNMSPNPIPASFTLTVNHASVSGFNMYGLSTGDFNGNFTPAALKGGNANVSLTYQSTIKAEADQNIDLPLRAVSQMSVGAASLILNFPSDLVQVVDVVMNGSDEPLSFSARGNELRIGWNSATPVYTFPGSDFIILKLRTTPAFAEGKQIRFEMVNDEMNELADPSMKTIPDANLSMDLVEFGTTGIVEQASNGLSMSCYPNPFSTYSTLTYVLPFDGKVSLTVSNILGVVVNTLVSETQTSGRYELKMDARTLSNGIYTAKLRLNSSDKEVVTVIKFVVEK